MYQVLYRDRVEVETPSWVMFASPTSDPFAAMRLLQQAKARHSEATVIQASTPSELALLVRRMVRRDLTDAEAPPLERVEAQPADARAAADDDTVIERLRWKIEEGPGGDHDAPYRFALPLSASESAHWLRLLVRHLQRAQVTAGSADTSETAGTV